jgi:hypothetical protein
VTVTRVAVLSATHDANGHLRLNTAPDDYDVEERAAILEYDAADVYPTRQAAERRARQLQAKQRAR